MCGQFLALKLQIDFLKSLGLSDEVISEITSSVVRPTDLYPVVTQGPKLISKRWGLIPAWSTGVPKASTFNARLETAAEKPTFKDAFARRRALISVAGFYEWSGPTHHRQKWIITRQDDDPLVFAGLWEGDTFTILTRSSGAQMSALHDREPVVVGRRQWPSWLRAEIDTPLRPPDTFYRLSPEGETPLQTALW